MDIYLDFEATQFKENIIAIGATCSYGSFDCLVKPPKGDKLTKFITKLTGITKEMAYNALSYDEAFFDLFNWINEMTEQSYSPVFYHVFGNMDKVFLQKAISYIKPKFLQKFVEDLSNSLIDDSHKVCKYFHTKAVGVYKALNYFESKELIQDHDPLNDAKALQKLMNYLFTAAPLEECPFEENNTSTNIPSAKIIGEKDATTKEKIIATYLLDKNARPRVFYSLNDAIEWILQRVRVQTPLAGEKNVRKKVNKAINQNGNYFNWNWRKEKI